MLYTRCIRSHESTDDRYGVCQRDGRQGNAAWLAHRRSADDALLGWSQSAAALAKLARWLAALALYAAVQSALAIFVSRAFPDVRWLEEVILAVQVTCDAIPAFFRVELGDSALCSIVQRCTLEAK